jgi:hypothetical protein
MSKAAEVRHKTGAYVLQLLIAMLIGGYGIIAIIRLPVFEALRIPTMYLVPFLLVYLIVLLCLIAARGPDKPSLPLLILGIFLIFGGAAFDMVATIVHSPDLSLEGNEFARALINSGHSLSFIYAYAIVAQFLTQSAFLLLWVIFLRHHRTLITLIWESNPNSKSEFFKAALGGEGYTWKQLFLSTRKPLSYYKQVFYHVLIPLSFIVIVLSPFRWWLGAEWFRLVPNVTDWMLVLLLTIGGGGAYFVWLLGHYEARKTPPT